MPSRRTRSRPSADIGSVESYRQAVGRRAAHGSISNRHLDLKPVVAAAAEQVDGAGAPISPERRGRIASKQHTPSMWVAMSPSPAMIERLEAANPGGWERLEARPGFRSWTDDYASAAGPSRRR